MNVSLIALFEMVPDETAAVERMEAQVWPRSRCRGHCGILDILISA